uniref:DH domain-containing protein n=2 Tax=Wuchereria bancrofti TaxID=6293 RepID=A0AAF5PYQ5_WUCBA
MSSIGRVRSRRPSLVEWTQHMNRYPSMDLDRRYEYCNTFHIEYYDEYGRAVGVPEKVQPFPGQILRDCLDHRLRQRGLVPSTVLFFVENSRTPLPDNCDANFLSGQRIVARVRKGMTRFGRSRTQQSLDIDINDTKPIRKSSDDSMSSWRNSLVNSKMLSRSRGNNLSSSHSGSGCQDYEPRTRKNSPTSQSILLNIALDEPSCSEDLSSIVLHDDSSVSGTRRLRNIAATSRRSLFFGKDKAEMLARLTLLKDEVQKPVPMFELESHWTNIVGDNEELSKHAYEQQEAIWEFVTTEHRYLQLLKQMNELCQCFLKMQEVGYMRDVDPRRVFLNYPELYLHNSKFWKKAVLPMLQTSRNNGTPLDPAILKSGFERIDEWWPCYTTFIYGHADCYSYVQKCQKENELFREFVTWAESQDTMRRQRLLDALTNPMQRLTRYSLLLKAVLKHTVDDTERDTIQDMIVRIEKATRNVEETLNNNDLQNKLNELSRAIESYEAVDCEEFEKIFPIKCYIRLADPMPYFVGQPQFRRVYLRADLKMKDGKQGTKVDAHCILFTDLFLICKASNKRYDRLRILKPPIHIAKMCLQRFPDYSGFVIAPINDFGMPSALYYLSTPSIEETRKWLEMTNMALRDFYRLKPLSPQQCLLGISMGLFNGFGLNDDIDHNRSNSSSGSNQEIINQEIIHRKSSSMDSQIVAEHNRIANVRKVNTVSSADQIDRLLREGQSVGNGICGSVKNNLISQHKLAVMVNDDRSLPSLVNTTLNGQSKSSTDLHFTSKSVEHLESPNLHRRSRSNSSGPTDVTRTYLNKSSKAGFSTHLYNKGHIYISDTPSTSLEHREGCDLRASQGTLDSSPDFSEQRIAERHDETVRCSSPSIIMTYANDESIGTSSSQMSNARRFERRYHTSDGIDITKPKIPTNLPPGILKRFSWNVSTAVGGSSRKITNRMNEQNIRRQSQSTVASSESFSSSTSGFSTASSYMEGSTVTEEMTPTDDFDMHISTVAIGEQLEDVAEDTRTLKIQLSDENINEIEKKETISVPPPLPDAPPPSLNGKEKGAGFGVTTAPLPSTTATSVLITANKGAEMTNSVKQQELLKFIMDNHLETSDV